MMKKKKGNYFRVYLLRRRKLRYGGEDDVIRLRATAADIILELFSSVPSSGWPVVVKWRRAVQIRDRHLRIRQKPNARVEYIYTCYTVYTVRVFWRWSTRLFQQSTRINVLVNHTRVVHSEFLLKCQWFVTVSGVAEFTTNADSHLVVEVIAN